MLNDIIKYLDHSYGQVITNLTRYAQTSLTQIQTALSSQVGRRLQTKNTETVRGG